MLGAWAFALSGNAPATLINRASPGIYDATAQGTNPPTKRVSKFGVGADFNGTSGQNCSYEIPGAFEIVDDDGNQTDQFTMCLWAKMDAQGIGDARMLAKSVSSTVTHTFMLSTIGTRGARMRITTSSETTLVGSNNMLPLGGWAHVCGTYDGANMRLYINGILDVSTAKTGNIELASDPVRIGDHPYNQSKEFDGMIEDIRIYNRCLTQEERMRIASRPLTMYEPHNKRLLIAVLGPAVAGGVTGSFTPTAPPGTCSFTGTVEHTGSFNPTAPAGTCSFQGTVEHTGSFNPVAPPGTCAFAGDVAHSGSFQVTAPAGTCAFQGTVEHVGSFNPTAPAGTCSFAGSVRKFIAGSFAPEAPPGVCAFQGFVDSGAIGGTPGIQLDVQMSRTSVAAPGRVFVDCSGTVAQGVTHPFLHLDFWINFGNAGHPDNDQYWPMGAMVYDGAVTSPVITVWCRNNLTGEVVSKQVIITVIPTGQQWAPAKTYVLREEGDVNNEAHWADAPPHLKVNRVVSTDIRQFVADKWADDRHLSVHRPQGAVSPLTTYTWNGFTVTLKGNGTGESLISAWGQGVNEDVYGIFENDPDIDFTGTFAGIWCVGANLRFEHLRFKRISGSQEMFQNWHNASPQGSGKLNRCLWHKVQMRGGPGLLINPVTNGQGQCEELSVFSCDFNYEGGAQCYMEWGKWCDATGSAFMNSGNGGHCLRVDGYQRSAIVRCTIEGSLAAVHNLKVYPKATSGANGEGRYLVIAKNKLKKTTADWMATLGTVDGGSGDANRSSKQTRFIANEYETGAGVQVAVIVNSKEVLFENELFVGAGGALGLSCVTAVRRGQEPAPEDVEMLYCTRDGGLDVNTSETMLTKGAGFVGTPKMTNCCIYSPSTTGTVALGSSGVTVLTSIANTDPKWANRLAGDYTPLDGSPLLEAATKVTTARDATGLLRD